MTFRFDELTRRLLLINHHEEVVAALEEVVDEQVDHAWRAARDLVQAEHDAEYERLRRGQRGEDPYRVPLLGNWLGGLKAAAGVLETRELSATAQRHVAAKEAAEVSR